MEQFGRWLIFTPLWLVALGLIAGLFLSALLGWWLRGRGVGPAADKGATDQEGYVLTAVSGLLALLIGFTFAMAIDRFDTRQNRVLEDANAIESAYLQAQLLGEPHRSRISSLLIAYTKNAIVLARTKPGPKREPIREHGERLKAELWNATAIAFPAIPNTDFAAGFALQISEIVNLDASREAGRSSHVPAEVYAVLFFYQLVAAGVFGFVMTGRRGRETAASLLLLFAISVLLVIDIDRPTTGLVRVPQDSMIRLWDTFRAHPPRTASTQTAQAN